MSIFNPSGRQYLRCTKRLDNKSCPGCGKIITSELEAVVYQQMVKKLEKHKTLTGRKKAAKANPKIAALQVELLHVDSEIEKLVDSLTGANNALMGSQHQHLVFQVVFLAGLHPVPDTDNSRLSP